ncbi:hypothetical protein B7494_g8003 [Chlorociboria aeruginascens]|nr:hypothetical protein B7494_g8003 [Chlorociboria aeruginascens]
MVLNNPSTVIPNSYIVTLKLTLTEEQRKAHMQFVKDICQNQHVSKSSGPTQVTRVLRYPANSLNPQLFTYFGKFNPEIEKKINDRKNEVQNIRLEQVGELNALGIIERPTTNWSLAAMSNTKEIFAKQWGKYKLKNSDRARKQADTFKYNGINKLGAGTRIYILDTGYHPQAIGAAELTKDRHKFFDMAHLGPEFAADLAWTGKLRADHKEKLKGHEFKDNDGVGFHGTNVAILAGLAAPEAQIVSILIAESIGGIVCPREQYLLDALALIGAMMDKYKVPTIINCSWRIGRPQDPEGVVSLLQSLQKKGACIVTSAGNEGLAVSEKGQINTPFSATSGHLPDALGDTILVGALEVTTTIDGEILLWITKETNKPSKEKPPRNLFLFAPGDNLPAWNPNGILPPDSSESNEHGMLPLVSGTSFAAPLVCGAIACLLSGQDKILAQDELTSNATQEVTQEQIPPRRKRQRTEAGLLDNPSKPQPSKRLKPSIKLHSAAFYDSLSKVWLTPRALKELDRRTSQANRPQQPASTPRRVTRTTSNKIERFARDGGPELRDLRGYPAPRNITRTMGSSNSSRSRRTESTMPTGVSSKVKRSSAYDRDFEQHLTDHNIYILNRKSKPGGLEGLRQRLSQRRPSLSPSCFSDNAFEIFQQKNEDVIGEGDVMRNVTPIICGDADIPNRQNLLFTQLDSIANSTTVDAMPDFYDGARRVDVDKKVLEDIKGYIIPTKHMMAPVAPNFFLEVKRPSGGVDVAKRQACYDGAIGARAMHQLQSYKQKLIYDGNTYTITSTYHDGTLKIYITHPTQAEDGTTEYHMSMVNAFALTGDPDTCRHGFTAFRNARDLAQEQRNVFISAANERARSVNSEPP